MRLLVRLGAAGLALTAGLGVLSGCTSDHSRDDPTPLVPYRLVAFNSCDDALGGLRTAAKAAVGPYGFAGYNNLATAGGAEIAVAPQAKSAPGGAATDSAGSSYSGTNTHEAGVDEPDLVKTDGHRIVTVTANTLTVVDAASRSVTGSLNLSPGNGFGYRPGELLLSGDQALVILRYANIYRGGVAVPDAVVKDAPGVGASGSGGAAIDAPRGVGSVVADPATGAPYLAGPRLLLISLAGQPRVLSSLTADGGILDARQVGPMARVVLRSSPRITFPYQENATDAQRVAANRSIIDRAPIDDWLPRIETTTGAVTRQVPINCGDISRPDVYTGANLLTVLSFRLGGASLGDGRPTTLVADGETVYSNGSSLYVASDQRFASTPDGSSTRQPTTVIYKFDTSGDQPTFSAGGSVPGYLINQYAMSEWDGNLRVATTTAPADGSRSATTSGVYVLSRDGRALKLRGSVTGLGKGERIYAVRFVGPTGYVVTFKQTDPLYTVDLSDPARPAARGELKIPGYSAYLHPIDGNRLIGIGQDATEQGRVTGTQVSLFDVSNLAAPSRITRYSMSGGYSEAEFDPHAFLYWPATGLLVVPLQGFPAPGTDLGAPTKMVATAGALVLRVSGGGIQQVGYLQHPVSAVTGYGAPIRRSLVIDRTLWTMSDGGLLASDLTSLAKTAWIPLA